MDVESYCCEDISCADDAAADDDDDADADEDDDDNNDTTKSRFDDSQMSFCMRMAKHNAPLKRR